MDIFIKILRNMRPRLVGEVVAFALVTAVLEVVSVWVLRSLFLVCLGQPHNPLGRLFSELPPLLSDSRSTDLLLTMLLGTFVFVIVKNLSFIAMWRGMLRRLAAEQTNAAWRLFDRTLRVPFAIHAKRSWASLQQNLLMVSNLLFLRLVVPALLALSEVLVLAGIMVFLLIKSPLLTILLGIWLGGTMALFRIWTTRASRTAGIGRNRSSEQLLRLAHEATSDFKTIKLRGYEGFFVKLFRNEAQGLSNYAASDRLMVQLPRFIFEPVLIGGLVVLYAILVGTHATQARVLSDLTLYAAAAMRILPATQRIVSQMHLLSFDQSAIAAIVAEFEQPIEELPSRAPADGPAPFQHALSFDGVTLCFAAGPTVLRDVSLSIQKGDKIAVIGRTGAGKTSFLNVMLGFVPPTNGRVLFDGDAVPPLTRFRQSSMAYVPQDPFLLDASVAENVAFATDAKNIDEERVWMALRRAHLEATIRKMPQALQTRVGENGMVLSGGERQRVALARAFYHNPSFLVLDEATSQLDVATEHAVLKDLIDQYPDITLIVVTHRMAATAFFRRRLRIEGGAVIQFDPEPSDNLPSR